MSRETARILVSGLIHDGLNADKLTPKARQEIRAAIELILSLTNGQGGTAA